MSVFAEFLVSFQVTIMMMELVDAEDLERTEVMGCHVSEEAQILRIKLSLILPTLLSRVT